MPRVELVQRQEIPEQRDVDHGIPASRLSSATNAATSDGIAEQVRDWCLTAPDHLRIVLCGYDQEHDTLLNHGWDVIEGKAGGGAGYSTRADNGRRERLWCSPSCLGTHRQDPLDLDAT